MAGRRSHRPRPGPNTNMGTRLLYATQGPFGWFARKILRVIGLTIISPGVEVGDGVFLVHSGTNVGIGLNTVVGDRVRIHHNVSIGGANPLGEQAGRIVIGHDCVIGIGAIVLTGDDDLVIAPGTIVGAGSVLLRSIETPGEIWAGVPARRLRARDDWPLASPAGAQAG